LCRRMSISKSSMRKCSTCRWGARRNTERTRASNSENANGFGIGFIESWIQQVTDDQGTTANRLNGFSGRAFGIGPIATYSTKLGKSQLDFNARWIHDFDVSKRFEGDGFNFTASLKF
jgi:hypothetical protein